MRAHGLVAFTISLVSACSLAQASVAGAWSDSTLMLVLAQGKTLTGRVKDGRADAHKISDGIVDGHTLRFTTAAMLNGKDVVIGWRGEWAGDELAVTCVILSAPPTDPYPPFNGPFILHRSQ